MIFSKVIIRILKAIVKKLLTVLAPKSETGVYIYAIYFLNYRYSTIYSVLVDLMDVQMT